VAVYTLGGTITCRHDDAGGAAPTLTPEQLLATVPGAAEIATVTTRPFRQVTSNALTLGDLIELVDSAYRETAGGNVAGVVVTTGTDTLDEAAFALDLLWTGSAPLVVTGAMRSADQPGADGAANLRAALRLAASPAAQGLGCLVAISDEIHAARHVRKTHTVRPAAFSSPNTGPVGYVHENRITIHTHPLGRPRPLSLAAGSLPGVALLHCGLGDDGRLLDAISTLGYRGLVIDSAGGGAVPPQWVNPLCRLARTMPVAYTSRAACGPVLQNTYNTPGCDRDLIARGVIPAGHLTGLQARILLTLLLASQAADQDIPAILQQPYTL
jgi:L-asparaginase